MLYWIFFQVVLLLIVLSGWLVSLALHEFGHAIVAYYGGDSTVADKVILYVHFTMFISPCSFHRVDPIDSSSTLINRQDY